eukprot:TRINITY_DN936_c0_g1_i3.p1 TRINITY_DN936_c0_g1~~TRINITY_DN936_c0_g1_i3.p1  ORF type:complete len:354 (-),score=80.21 TRINITY_DN936_c0_g1_i3:45-1106(-)
MTDSKLITERSSSNYWNGNVWHLKKQHNYSASVTIPGDKVLHAVGPQLIKATSYHHFDFVTVTWTIPFCGNDTKGARTRILLKINDDFVCENSHFSVDEWGLQTIIFNATLSDVAPRDWVFQLYAVSDKGNVHLPHFNPACIESTVEPHLFSTFDLVGVIVRKDGQGSGTTNQDDKYVRTLDGKPTPIVIGSYYRIKTVSTGAVLDDRGGKVGDGHTVTTNVGLQDDVYNTYDKHRTWTFKKVDGGYRIKTLSTGAVLDDRGGKVGDGHKIITNVGLQDDVYNTYDKHRTWNLVKVDGGYRIKTLSTGAVLDDCGGKVGDGHTVTTNVGLQDDVYNDADKHRTWNFVPVELKK